MAKLCQCGCASVAVPALGLAAPWVLGWVRWAHDSRLPTSSNGSAGRAHPWLWLCWSHRADQALWVLSCWSVGARREPGREPFPPGCSGLQAGLCLEQSCKTPRTARHCPSPAMQHREGLALCRAAHQGVRAPQGCEEGSLSPVELPCCKPGIGTVCWCWYCVPMLVLCAGVGALCPCRPAPLTHLWQHSALWP